MKLQAIDNSPNFGARIKINKKISQGILADSLTTTYVPTDLFSGIPFEDLKSTKKYVKLLDEKSLFNNVMKRIFDKHDKKIPS